LVLRQNFHTFPCPTRIYTPSNVLLLKVYPPLQNLLRKSYVCKEYFSCEIPNHSFIKNLP
jgi:hypothetical protein